MNKIYLLFVIPLLIILTLGTTITSYAESDWKIYQLNATTNGNTVHFKVPYQITNGNLQKINYNTSGISASINNVSNNGIFVITIPKDLYNPQFRGNDYMFYVLIDGQEIRYQKHDSPCFRTISIPLKSNSKIVTFSTGNTMDLPIQISSAVPPIYITANKTDSQQFQFITISGCTDLALDGKQVNLALIDSQGKTNVIYSVIPNINGTFSFGSATQGMIVNYTKVLATYAGQNSTENFAVVPEFPTTIIVLLISTSLLILISSRSRLKF
jgi:predicted secreted protein with PEFG-CTERM motif